MATNDLTLGEELMLLSLDDDKGVAKEQQRVGYAVAGAALVELALAGRIEVTDEKAPKVLVRDAAPVGVAPLDGVLASVAGREKPRTAQDWVSRLASDTVKSARESLVDRGLVREEHKKVLGIFPRQTFPEADGGPEAALRQRLSDVLVAGAEPDERTAALVVVLHGAGLSKLLVPEDRSVTAKELDARMKEIAASHWAAKAVRRTIEGVQAAVIAAVMIPTIVTTTA